MQADFLQVDIEDPQYADVVGVLLDPSCSGSGTAASRLDHLLPSHREAGAEMDEVMLVRRPASHGGIIGLAHGCCWQASYSPFSAVRVSS